MAHPLVAINNSPVASGIENWVRETLDVASTVTLQTHVMKCKYCSTQLRPKHRFCYYCGKIARCLSCNTKLPKNAVACSTCGAFTSNVTAKLDPHRNVFTLEENEKGRKISTDFTDKTAEGFSSVLEKVIGRKISGGVSDKPALEAGDDDQTVDAEILESASSVTETSKMAHPASSNEVKLDTRLADRVFVYRNGSWKLGATDLKADNQKDYGRRILLLYLLLGEEQDFTISNTEMNSVLKREGVYDGGVRSYMSSNGDYSIHDGIYELNQYGRREVESILKEVFDESIAKTWRPGTKKSSSNSSKGNTSAKYTVEELPLTGPQTLKLKETYESLKSKTHVNKLLLLIDFVVENSELEGLTVNQVYSACRKIGIEAPKDIRGAITTGEKRGYFDKPSRGQFKVNAIGKKELDNQLTDDN